jgi:membrane-bound serine protease (ClpP class)
MARPGLRPLLVLLLGLAVGFGAAGAPGQEEAGNAAGRGQVWVVDLDGAVGPASVDLIIRSIADAEDAGAQALIIRMDTPGGLDKSMRDLVKEILAADVPVITYVAPDGARAASAGTYIAYASHIAAMAPATNIGSATPVTIGGGSAPTPGTPPPPDVPKPGGAPEQSPASGPDGGGQGQEGGGEQGAPEAAPATPASTDAMTRKVINDAVAYLQGLAELRGRNIEWAEEAVRYGANLRASEALEMNVIDVVAPNLRSLLEDLDGRSVTLNTRTVTLNVADAGVRQVETDWQHDLLTIITDPSIAYGLLIFGFYGLILEFYNPGMIFPSVIGIVCLLLGAYGLQMLPINYAGLALIVVGIGLMIAEVFTPTFGIMGIGGVVAFVIGSVILMDTEAPGYQVPFLVIGAFAAATAGLSMLAIGAAVQARRQRVATGQEAMLGQRAEALEDFSGNGHVWAFSERWNAHTDAPVKKGDIVTITGIDGLTLKVTAE